MKLTGKGVAWTIFTSVLLGIILSSMALWQTGILELKNILTHINWVWLKYYLVVSLFIAIFLAIKWRLVLKSYGFKLPLHTLFIYRLIGFAVSYITPVAHVGGEPVRALLLHKHKVPLKVAFSASIVDRSIEILFNLMAFFIGSLIILNSTQFPRVARISIFMISLIAVSIVSIITFLVLNKQKIFSKILKPFFKKKDSWQQIKNNADEVEALIEAFYKKKSYFLRSLLINIFLWILMFLEYKFALLMLGYDSGFFAIFLFLTGIGVAYSIPIPAAFGVLELGQISVSKILSISTAIGFGLAIIVRIRDLLWTISGLILVIFYRLNAFNLFKRSQVYAEKYNFQNLDWHSFMFEQAKTMQQKRIIFTNRIKRKLLSPKKRTLRSNKIRTTRWRGKK